MYMKHMISELQIIISYAHYRFQSSDAITLQAQLSNAAPLANFLDSHDEGVI